ncbi:site-specific integrase [Mycobacterium sp. shizuoka-1]|uniref:tyrosine-type recombinase/integrase n=1 Tax=Mycobacterium sp. shizuoka-1 TaxID=2039281 RepID=UPI000C08A392|nr:site-specific integrase [Mycobacterium sp. shizuoka-1]
MASLRTRTRSDGTEYYAVLYRLKGKQTSTSFDDFALAEKFCNLASKFGVENALSTLQVEQTLATLTVGQWVEHHINHLTGVDPNTITKYRTYLRNDIAEPLGSMPLAALTRDHIAQWIKGMQQPNAKGKVVSAKTITNKHGFLAGALNTAVTAGHIPANPCTGMGMPRDDDEREKVFLTSEQFALLHSKVTDYWKPMVEFMVASGARIGEVVALRPSDINLEAGTVRIRQSWKYGGAERGYTLGTTKTRKSKRTINVPKSVLARLDLTNEFVFVNREGRPVRQHGFSARVWSPAVEKAWPSRDKDGREYKNPLRPRVHDLRHTCASWMIQRGVPLPVIQEHLGHESIQTTIAVYGHLDRSSMEAASDAIGAALGM